MKRERLNGYLDDIEHALRDVFTTSHDEDEAFDAATRSLDVLREWVNVTENVTSVPPTAEDPQNTGSKPEGDSNWAFCPPEGWW